MARRQVSVPCDACKRPTPGARLSRVVIEGKTVALCREDAAAVAANMPRTFEELRALFREPASDGAAPGRRSAISRRTPDDRRTFPPRPEGRRMASGRRADDDRAA